MGIRRWVAAQPAWEGLFGVTPGSRWWRLTAGFYALIVACECIFLVLALVLQSPVLGGAVILLVLFSNLGQEVARTWRRSRAGAGGSRWDRWFPRAAVVIWFPAAGVYLVGLLYLTQEWAFALIPTGLGLLLLLAFAGQLAGLMRWARKRRAPRVHEEVVD